MSKTDRSNIHGFHLSRNDMYRLGFKTMAGYRDTFINQNGVVYFMSEYGVIKKGGISISLRPQFVAIVMKNRRKYWKTVLARIVLTLFSKQKHSPTDKAFHLDGNPYNNHISNLRWVKQEDIWRQCRKHNSNLIKHYKESK